MDNYKRYSIDDTILNDPVRKVSFNLKGVTHFNRQDNLKLFYEKHLPKEEKNLTLEKYTDNTVETFCIKYNGLEIGTIPKEQLALFLSPSYDYNLDNIHIDKFTNEYGKEIYWAKMYVIFTPKPLPRISPPKPMPPIITNPKQPHTPSAQGSTFSPTDNENKPKTRAELQNDSQDVSHAALMIMLWLLIGSVVLLISITEHNILTLIIAFFIYAYAIAYIGDTIYSVRLSSTLNPTNAEIEMIKKYRKKPKQVKKQIVSYMGKRLLPLESKNKDKLSSGECRLIKAFRQSSAQTQNKVKEILDN